MAIVKISDLPMVDEPVQGTDLFVVVQDNVTKKAFASDIQTYVGFEEVQTATAGQTVFNLTTMTYAAGANNLMVFVDGVNQYEGSSYQETDNNTVTFTQGLHEGALVKFSTVQTQTSEVSNAAAVVYNPAGTGAVPTNVQNKLRETVSVKDFGALGDGVTDDTAAINAAIDYLRNTTRGGVLLLPAGTYMVTSINASHFGALFDKNLVIRGEGLFASRLIGTQAGAIVLDCIGSNNVELEEFYIGTSGVAAQAGLLLARSTTSTNCNGGRFTNISIEGSFSIACCASIAAEGSIWYSPRFHNTYSPANYTSFITSNRNVGISSANGTIYASSNTQCAMYAPTFYEPYGANTVAVRFVGSAGYDIYSALVISGNTAGGILCQYEVDPGTGIFRGDVVWHNPLLEGKSPKMHYLVGDGGGVDNYFYGIKQHDGYCNHYDTTSFDLLIGDPVSAKYNLYDCEINKPRFNPGTTPVVTCLVLSRSIIDIEGGATSNETLNVTGFINKSYYTASIYNLGTQSFGVPGQSAGTAPPVSGSYPKNFIFWNENPSFGQPIGWVCITAGTPGTWRAFGLINNSIGFCLLGINEYANNTAALAAGLGAGNLYRTGDILKIVH